MKKITLLLFLVTLFVNAQIPQNAPWLNTQNNNQKTSKETFSQIIENAEGYFKNIDVHKKGSGYKPFKRWEYHWDFYTQKDESIAPPSLLWSAWEQKNALINSTLVESNWQSIGPYSFIDSGSWSSGQGRVNFVAVDPNNLNTYYVGSPAGGIWKSTDAGVSWIPLTDYLPQIGVSGIAIDPNNSNIIYITTGDDDAGDSYFVGVMKSTDGGITWNSTGSLSGTSANEIYIDPSNSQIIWVATSSGLYKSTDSGTSWALKLSGNIKDFKLKPNNPTIIYAVTSNTFYRSTDGGTSFSTITSGLPTSSSRLTIDVTPANSEYVYLLSAKSDQSFQGLYKSTNGGSTFIKTSQTTDIFDGSSQAWYDLALTVSNTNANTVFVGVLNIWKSINGGNSFTKINDWNNDTSVTYTHADIHFLRYYNGVLFAGTDGGVFRSTNNGSSFSNLTKGLAIGQFYRISVANKSSENIVGGLQDNGGFAKSNNSWYNYYGADGMDAAVNPQNKNEYYGFIQYGNALYKTENGGVSSSYVASSPSDGNWVTPLVANNSGVLYAGFSNLYKLQGFQWIQVSNQNFGGNLNVIEIDPSDNNIIYVSRGTSLYKSIDGGITFSNLPALFAGTSISSIEVNNHNSNIVYLTTSGSTGKVYKSTDSGSSWTDISNNLPQESKNVVRHQKYNSNNPIYVGTYLGVYYLDDTSSTWQVFSTNLPNSEVTDIEITSVDAKITASTYGRGIWQSSIPVILADNDIALIDVVEPTSSISCDNISPIIKVKNNGLNTVSQINIDYSVDNTPYNQSWSGSLSSNQTIDITLNDVLVNKGIHTLDITTSIENDTYSDNNEGTVTFYKNDNDDTPNVINNFENTEDEWVVITSGTTENLWQMASPGGTSTLLTTVASGTKAYITNPNGNYTDYTTSNLVSPCYNLTTIQNPVMRFKLAFDLEEDWDVLYVQYSIDNGLNWQVLGTASDPNWYNNSSSENELTIGGQWSGTNTTLQEYSYDLSDFTNESQIMFRFHFASDQLVNGEGALIDDFVIDGTLADNQTQYENLVSLYPNPTEGIFTINWPHTEKAKISIFDMLGKKVAENTISPDSFINISTDSFSKGMYVIQFETSKMTFSKKLIVK